MSLTNIVIKDSKIHGLGVFAAKDLKKGTYIIEYFGEKITKAEGDRRTVQRMQEAKKDSSLGGVYIFELNKRYDLDGKTIENNPARLINHSCTPNCETLNDKGHIWIIALKDIKEGEELKYNYGYEYGDDWKDYPCKCGESNCLGYIIHKKHWKKIQKLLNNEAK